MQIAIEDVLGNRLRVKILKVLFQMGELNVSEIARKIGANHKTVKEHLEVLKENGLLQYKKFGRIHLYRLNEGSVRAIALKKFMEAWETVENFNASRNH
ncbi:MAG: winged helix-turn-helix domain-containing protein [Candidatus Bathyarchaeia archaeon]